MKSQIKYIELKSSYNDNGPAWIGMVSFSKSGKTLYFNNTAFQSLGGSGIAGNYFDVETDDEYWISNPKKNLTDRHRFGGGTIAVEKRILPEYLKIIGRTELPKKGYELVDVDVNIPKERITALENERLEPIEFDARLHFKKPNELTIEELQFLIEDLNSNEENSIYKKSRKSIKKRRFELEQELEKR
ncbi:hypothetical protein KORDIASMS9_00322 [Kordia sp. SMS9]|uniref:hypothetical protein n=1 Tax=Kordia sp. SMS9 TaxID=2282170 RepID=UPI000E10C11C|nr:hypothetical protein [Kordia sp. SMS9]AXG68132.1 hypothetical protein KORDIASMS9_00322 [Kordia sp. SMS9]